MAFSTARSMELVLAAIKSILSMKICL